MPYRRKKRRTKRPRRKTYRKRKSTIPNTIHLGAGLLPDRAYVKHKYSRQISLGTDYSLPSVTSNGSDRHPVTLIASCNNPIGAINQAGITTVFPDDNNNPAFLPAFGNSSLSNGNFDNNNYPNLWQFFQRMYSQYTVVGSKIRVSYIPDAFGLTPGSGDVPGLKFVLMRKPSTQIVGSGTSQTYPTPNSQPSRSEEQPGAKTRDWTRISNFSGKAVVQTMGFSAKREFGKGSGNVVAESNLQGPASGVPTESLNGAVAEQSYWHWVIFPVVTGAVSSPVIPRGVFNIDIEYETVWTERAYIPDS